MDEKAQEWIVYMIQTEDGKLYTGITNNLERRFREHQKQRKEGARFFYFSKPEKIVFREQHSTRSEASKRECSIKKMTKTQKLSLIEVS